MTNNFFETCLLSVFTLITSMGCAMQTSKIHSHYQVNAEQLFIQNTDGQWQAAPTRFQEYELPVTFVAVLRSVMVW